MFNKVIFRMFIDIKPIVVNAKYIIKVSRNDEFVSSSILDSDNLTIPNITIIIKNPAISIEVAIIMLPKFFTTIK